MSDVLIKGMKMPTCCFYCEMCYQDQDSEHCITSRCAAQEHKEIFPDKSVRDDDCPLIEVPSADVAEMVRGKWLHKEITADFHVVGQCSVCKERRRIDNFCPNCGARMDGE